VSASRVVLLSPHFDDVPLSLGQSLTDGVLSQHEVTVVVVFSRTNWTRWFHPTPSGPRTWASSRWRRLEEAVAGRRFGYRVVTLGLPEWMLRTGRSDLTSLLDPTADVAGDPVVDQILDRVAGLVGTADAVAACAAIGHHVDHQVVREVGARLVDDGVPDVAFYEDRPYAALVPPPELDAGVDWLARRLDRKVVSVPVSGPVGSRLHRRLRRTYPSQIDELFVTAMSTDEAAGAVERVLLPDGPAGIWPLADPAR